MSPGSSRKRKAPEMPTVPVVLPESPVVTDGEAPTTPRTKSYIDEKGEVIYGKTRRKKKLKRENKNYQDKPFYKLFKIT